MTSNGNLERSMTMMSFGRAMGVNTSQSSLASSAAQSVKQGDPAPPVPRVPSIYHTAVVSSADQYAPLSRTPSTSSTSLELPIRPPPSPAGETPHLCHGPRQHAITMPSPSVMSMQASIASTIASPTRTVHPSIKRKPVPNAQPSISTQYVKVKTDMQEMTWMPPHAPTRSDFPGDPLEQRHLATTNPTLPSEDEVQAYLAELDNLKAAAKKEDPYHRTIHDAYLHVFRTKPRPTQRPKIKRNETSRASKAFSNALNGFKNAVESFAAHRHRPAGGPNGIGMSIPIQNSFHDFKAQGQHFHSVLHPDLKAVPIAEARTRFARQHKSIETGRAAKAKRFAARPRMVSTIEEDGRAPLVGHFDFDFDFDANDLFDPSIEDPIESPLPRPRIRRARNGRNRGSSKPLPPLPKEAWLPPDAPEGYFDLPKPRRRRSTPQTPERIPALLDGSVCEHSDSPAEPAIGDHPHQHRSSDNTHPAAVAYHFDSIDDAVAKHSALNESDKHWASEELHRMDEILDRERRASDGSIIIDTFPHNGHTSWRATERTSDHVIHSDYRRFSREVNDGDSRQDGAGLLMERLSRQMRGS